MKKWKRIEGVERQEMLLIKAYRERLDDAMKARMRLASFRMGRHKKYSLSIRKS